MDTTRFNTPASFNYNQDANNLINSPSNPHMQLSPPDSSFINSIGNDDFGGLDLLLETEIKESYIDAHSNFLA